MPKKNCFSDITLHKTTSTPKKSNIDSPKSNITTRKSSKKNSVIWLQEAYDTSHAETALWVAVITQAMMDALSQCKKTESMYHKHDAINWLTTGSKDFVDVCVAAGMNPNYVRRKAKQVLISPIPWRAEPGKGKRYLERKEYRKKQRQKEKEQNEEPRVCAQIISIC